MLSAFVAIIVTIALTALGNKSVMETCSNGSALRILPGMSLCCAWSRLCRSIVVLAAVRLDDRAVAPGDGQLPQRVRGPG